MLSLWGNWLFVHMVSDLQYFTSNPVFRGLLCVAHSNFHWCVRYMSPSDLIPHQGSCWRTNLPETEDYVWTRLKTALSIIWAKFFLTFKVWVSPLKLNPEVLLLLPQICASLKILCWNWPGMIHSAVLHCSLFQKLHLFRLPNRMLFKKNPQVCSIHSADLSYCALRKMSS